MATFFLAPNSIFFNIDSFSYYFCPEDFFFYFCDSDYSNFTMVTDSKYNLNICYSSPEDIDMDEAIPISQGQNNAQTNSIPNPGNNSLSENDTEMLEASLYYGSSSWGYDGLANINPEPSDVNALDVSSESTTASTSNSTNPLRKREREDIDSSFEIDNDSHKDKKSKK